MPLPETPKRPSAALLTWCSLVVLTLVSVFAAQAAHTGTGRFWMTVAVALIAWGKGLLLIRHFLEAPRAGRHFHRLVLGFCALAPLLLLVSAWRELVGG